MSETTPRPTPRTRPEPGQIYPEHFVRVYEFIEEYIQTNKFPPSNREMVDAGLASSTSVLRYYYERMEKYGMIEIIPKIARGMRIFPRSKWKKNPQPVEIKQEKEPVHEYA